MAVIKRMTCYFDKPGFQNTSSVIEVIQERLKTGDIDSIVVPVTTGRTAELFYRTLKEEAKIITISEDEVLKVCERIIETDQSIVARFLKGKLKDRKDKPRDLFDMTILPFCGESWNVIKETLYMFSQGMKVAIEITIAAVEAKKIQPYTKIIAVGGTGEGADTAICIRSSTQKEAFGKNPEKRLTVFEILAMPIEKS